MGSSAAYLVSDRARFDSAGNLIARHRKVIGSRRLRLAITGHGYMLQGKVHRRLVNEWIARQSTQEDALASLPALTRDLDARILSAPEEERLKLFVATWSAERSAPALYIISGTDLGLADCYEPFTLRPIGDVMAPRAPGFDLDIAAHFPRFEPARFARALLTEQRKAEFACGGCRVGVAGDLTVVTADGVKTRRVILWPDVIGKPLARGLERDWRQWGRWLWDRI